ncbi:Neurexin 1, isoform A [Actinomortierella ambigua]|uniref:protein-disulfide reductase n=1 Tax=Actinomortierella ambigua TaxID=1343610 RepID=A0A9P6QMC9_9FUNG|nr:Neurexin 1, isoform A [Actinomortierella ambigua]
MSAAETAPLLQAEAPPAVQGAPDSTTNTNVEERRKRAKATIDKSESILFRIKLQDAQGNKVPVYELADKTIGFLCGAGRFAVCQELALQIDEFLEHHPKFTLVYVSLDRQKSTFDRILEAHPRWLAVPYDDPIRIDILNSWKTQGVPCLHIYDPVEHQIVTSWGGSCLRFNADKCYEEWQQGSQGISWWQMLMGWWYYQPPQGVFKDVTEEELAVQSYAELGIGAPSQTAGGQERAAESKKDK